MKRIAVAIAFLAGFGAAGVLSSGVVAAAVSTLAQTTTTTTAPTTTAPTTTTQPPPPSVIPAGVTLSGVAIGGMTPQQAIDAVTSSFSRPLLLQVGRSTLAPSPARLGAVAYVRTAVARARVSPPGSAVPLAVAVRGQTTRAYLAGVARRFDRKAVESVLTLRNFRPWISKERTGRMLDKPAALRAVVRALKTHRRGPLRLTLRTIKPTVTRASFGPIIVIRRESKRLLLYRGMRYWRVFGVATGQASYPTPLGRFSIAVKWANPWWYPPSSEWARGLKPIPPGPGNPLGTRWMGLTAPLIGIHGTPDAASIGYSASHGCIRMRVPEAEWLFNQVDIGTPVFIVAV